MKDLISIKDLTAKDIQALFKLTDQLKRDKHKFIRALSGKTLALIFQKPSNRTRVSFEVGMYQLGGNAIYLGPDEINLGVREAVKDVARTLSRYVDIIALRTFSHKNVIELAEYANVPVVNALSDFEHPCQALADIYTVREKLKSLRNKIFAYVGDGNNVCNSLIYACAKVGLNLHIASPKGYEPEITGRMKLFYNPKDAVRGADVIYTDVWTSMGQEAEAKKRKRIFKEFQVNAKLVRLARPGALIMHCLPAHRGEEITDQVMEGPNSVIFDQVENRMHVQKALLIKLEK